MREKGSGIRGWRFQRSRFPGARHTFFVSLLLIGALLLAGCGGGDREAAGVPATPPATAGPAPVQARATDFVVPTLYPTFTRPADQATATRPRPDTPTPGPTVDFEQKVLEFRYSIPALGLDRRLEGDISGRITVVDEAVGIAALIPNQSGALLEMQQALAQLELEPVPEDCARCVAFSYELPLEGQSGQGWLQDPVLLASVENYTTLTVGPHFPPGTVVGLRRSASPYEPAHALALTVEGRLYRWLATDSRVPEPLPAAQISPTLASEAMALPSRELQAAYTVDCVSAPVETLYLNPSGQGTVVEEAGQAIRLVCPAFALPSTLLPLYLDLDRLLSQSIDEVGLETPPPAIPLATMLDYRRADGARLALLLDGTAQLTSAAGETLTATVSSSRVVSLTTALSQTAALRPGLAAFTAGQSPNLLLVRTPQGLLEAAWTTETGPPSALTGPLAELDALLETLAGSAAPDLPALPPTATPSTPAETPTVAKPVTTPLGTAVPLATGTATPAATP